MACRIWAPSRPLASGLVIAATRERSDAGLTTVGLVTSLIVDNQLMDIDRGAHRLQYHAVEVPSQDPEASREVINGRSSGCWWMRGGHD